MAKNNFNWTDGDPVLSTTAKQLLECYAKIPADQIEDHIKNIREKAFAIYNYPCIGNYRFLDIGLHSSTAHDEVITRICGGANYLDLGCCFATEIRYLVSHGCPGENIYGAELRPVFIDFGYDLFHDRDTLKATFLTPFDIFSTELPAEINGKIDIINASSFFHLFSWQDSITIAKKVVSFLRPITGSLVVGRQVGSRGEDGPKDENNEDLRYRHNADSWKRMWDEVGKQTDSEWDVDFWWDETRNANVKNLEIRRTQRFYYVVRRR